MAGRLEHSAARCRIPTLLHNERLARVVHKNRVVILVGLTGSGKSTQVPQFFLEEKEEKEEKEDDPIDDGSGGSDNPCRPPNDIWEQQWRRQL